MTKNTEQRVQALQFASILNPQSVNELLSAAKEIEAYLYSASVRRSGQDSKND